MRNLLPLGVKHLSSRLARHMLITINLNAGLSARRAKGAKMILGVLAFVLFSCMALAGLLKDNEACKPERGAK